MHTVLCPGFLGDITAGQYRDDLQAEFLSKSIVTLIMGRYSHDGTGSMGCQYIVRNPDWNLLAIDRVDGIGTCEYTGLVLVELSAHQVRLLFCFFAVSIHSSLLLWCRNFFNKRMFRCQHTVCSTKQCIAAGCKDCELLVCAIDPKDNIGTHRLADPVALHFLGGFRPVKIIQAFQQLFCIGSNLHDPLAHRFTDDRIAAALTLAVNDFLIGQHSFQLRAPVDRHISLISQSCLIHLEEDPLCPLVVVRITGTDFSVPVIGEAQ